MLRTAAESLVAELLTTRSDASERPAPDVWSVLGYRCHVRDLSRLFDERLGLMLTEDDPVFANWNPNDTAEAERYEMHDPLHHLWDVQI